MARPSHHRTKLYILLLIQIFRKSYRCTEFASKIGVLAKLHTLFLFLKTILPQLQVFFTLNGHVTNCCQRSSVCSIVQQFLAGVLSSFYHRFVLMFSLGLERIT